MRWPLVAILVLRLRAGHGSIVCIAALAATASPAPNVTPSRWSTYISEQPPSEAPSAAAATAAAIRRGADGAVERALDPDLGSVPDRHIDASLFWQIEDMTDIRAVERAGGEPHQRRAHLGLAHQEKVDVVARLGAVERRVGDGRRRHRPHDMRRHHDHQFGLVLLVLAGAKQGAENRHVADPRQLI